jgi:tetratricopeptide (TPR) repeat protein
LVHGLFDARQYVDLWTMWPLFVLLGLLVAARSRVGSVLGTVSLQRWHWAAAALIAIGCVLAWRPLAAVTWANLGAVRQMKGELAALPEETRGQYLEGARVTYGRALAADPGNRTANLRLGNLAVARGQYAEGVRHLETVWLASPHDPTARKALGLAYVWVGELDVAAELLEGSANIVAELNTWGWWHGQQGRRQEAASAYRTSLTLDPDQPSVRELLAELEGQSGHLPPADDLGNGTGL